MRGTLRAYGHIGQCSCQFYEYQFVLKLPVVHEPGHLRVSFEQNIVSAEKNKLIDLPDYIYRRICI